MRKKFFKGEREGQYRLDKGSKTQLSTKQFGNAFGCVSAMDMNVSF
jgi:hypothetical protein